MRLSPGFSVRAEYRERLADLFEQSLGEAGLGDEGVAPRIHRALRMSGERVAGEGDDGDALRARVSLEPPGRLPAVDPRQREVHHDEIGQQREGLLQRFVAIL